MTYGSSGARGSRNSARGGGQHVEPDSPTPVAVTVAGLTEGQWPARFEALARLPADERVPAELHGAVAGLLAAPEAEQRAAAVAAVARVGAPAVPLLLAMLADEPHDADTRRAVV